MTKPKNPKPINLAPVKIEPRLPKDWGKFSDGNRPAWQDQYDSGYAAGLRDGEARLARALRRWLNNQIGGNFMIDVLFDWLTARQKSRRKKTNPLEKLYKTKEFKKEWTK